MSLKDIFRRKSPSPEGNMEEVPAGALQIGNKIGEEQIREAYHLLNLYKRGKANLEAKIIANEEWFKLRHWEQLKGERKEVEPASAWLFNAIANKHASTMDNFPAPNILPREAQDKAEADALSAIIPIILDGCGFEETYDEATYYKLKTGTACYSVLWDTSLHNGLGDINVKSVDLLNLFWEPGITDIQKSRNVFHVELCDIDVLEAQYPELEGRLSKGSIDIARYNYDDNVDTSRKCAVVDWYYKKRVGTRNVLHYCKFVGNTVIFATENEPQYAESGWYADGEYPFVFDKLFPLAGTPCGFGYIDVGKNTQAYIDRMGQAILENGLANATPRHFVPVAGNVNEEEFLDRNKPLIHYTGNGDGIVPVQTNTLSNIYYEVYQGKIDELKETTGNRDVNTGGTASGVTAASAIAAMQEAGSRLDRDDIKASYRAYRRIVVMCIERIRQFYDLPRYFRILGPDGGYQFVEYQNDNIRMKPIRFENGQPTEFRLPYFDVEVTAQKQSPYSKMSQNELALQFYGAGFFNPQMSDQALACLEMMDFDRKSFVMQKIAENGAIYQQIMMMQQQMMGMAPSAPEGSGEKVSLGEESKESSVTENARKRVAESTTPT